MHRDFVCASRRRRRCLYHRLVADHEEASPDPSAEPTPGLTPDPSPKAASDLSPEPAVSRVPQKVTRTSSPLTPIALVVALIAAGLAVWALVKSPDQSPPAASSPAESSTASAADAVEPGDAKKRVCDAAQVVAVAVQLQTNANAAEPAAVEAVAANARLAMLGGGEYVLSQIDADTPTELADPARSFGNTLRVLGITALAGVAASDPANQERIAQWEKDRNTLAGICTK